jgi:hypothetical protein
MDTTEMDQIMMERTEKFNQFVMTLDIENIPIGLFSGKMGICIYFYHQAQFIQSKEYESFSEKLLDSIYSQLSIKSLINLEDGLIGICLGLNYLIDKGFLKGNINNVLSELDDKIYQATWLILKNNSSSSTETMNNVFEVALYFSIRLQNTKLNKNDRFLFEAIVIKALNYLDSTFSYPEKSFEQLNYSLNKYFLANYIYLIANIYKLGFYNYKIDKIIDEIYPKLITTYPLLQSNRIQLIVALEYLNSELNRKSIELYIIRLKQEIDYHFIITSEFRNKNILLTNGLCGMFLIQNILFKNTSLPEKLIIDKIVKSELLDDIYKNEVRLYASMGLFTGLAGVLLIYQHLIK